ncbi:hypothetical protein E1A91_D06G097900v1, partial [Gossypium mustelinum]
KRGILKKAKELSILCDVELVLLLSSPTGKPTLFVGQNPNGLYNILQKVSNMPFVEREERDLKNLEIIVYLNQIEFMEDYLIESLNELRNMK